MNGHVTKFIDPEQLFVELAKWITPGRVPAEVSATVNRNADTTIPTDLALSETEHYFYGQRSRQHCVNHQCH